MSKRKAAKVLSFNFIQDLNSNVFISKIIWIAKPVARPSKKRRMNNWVNSVNKNATLIPPTAAGFVPMFSPTQQPVWTYFIPQGNLKEYDVIGQSHNRFLGVSHAGIK